MRMMLRIELARNADRLARRRRRRGCPAATLPTVRPPFSTSNGTSYPKIDEEDQHAYDCAHDAGRRCEVRRRSRAR